MNKISYKEVPNCYLYCIQSDCPMADHCLRQMAMHVITKRDTIINIVNPLLTLPSEQCEYFRSDEGGDVAPAVCGIHESPKS